MIFLTWFFKNQVQNNRGSGRGMIPYIRIPLSAFHTIQDRPSLSNTFAINTQWTEIFPLWNCRGNKCQRNPFFADNKNYKNAYKMSGVIFNSFFIGGPKRVEFPIGIIDYGSQCNMLYWMYYHSGLGQGPLEKWTKD